MLLWRKDVNVIVHSYSVSHIDAVIAKEDGTEGWRFIGVYGNPEAARRIKTWTLLRSLCRSSLRHWLCAGDFNEILSQDEKTGAPRPRKQIEEFRDCLLDCQLSDLGFRGAKFTWSNHREGAANVFVRLDRACASPDWTSLFPAASVMTEKARGSDHAPLVISLDARYFRATRDDGNSFDLRPCGHAMQPVERLSVGHRIEPGQGQRGKDSSASFDIAELREKLDELLAREEIMWKQRGKAQWLREGDLNTAFFHARANARQRKNAISRLRNLDGSWSSSADEVQKIVTDYFQVLFNSSNTSDEDIETAIEGLPVRVSTEMNEQLLLPFTADEINVVESGTRENMPNQERGENDEHRAIPDTYGSIYPQHYSALDTPRMPQSYRPITSGSKRSQYSEDPLATANPTD
ncbi:UNVERIFIED_CONTAM: hypothetical protein Sradi_2400900 [Sesamum radiatum]|uniref:Endonuclease/exonuclease/phosphatase domain-containing protein n=1 Tax=Sesamum radiatum TaxID=300843 RepID=A0AAW2SJE1_SESRA